MWDKRWCIYLTGLENIGLIKLKRRPLIETLISGTEYEKLWGPRHQHRNTLSKISSNYINDNIPENTEERVVRIGAQQSNEMFNYCLYLPLTENEVAAERARIQQRVSAPPWPNPEKQRRDACCLDELWEHRRKHRLTEVSSVSSEERCDVMRSSSTVLNTNCTALIQAFITANKHRDKRQEFDHMIISNTFIDSNQASYDATLWMSL